MSTAWCLSVAFCTPWVVGAPLAWLLWGRRRALRPADWLWAPFLGLAGVAVVLQNLTVYADLTLRQSTPWFVGSVALGWLVMLAAQTGRASLRALPVRVLGLALLVYLSQGIGVLVQGVEQYRGNLQSDQYQYVLTGQFLIDEPFQTEVNDIGPRPWVLQAYALKSDRLGQSVIHGFVAVVAGRDALDLFFPVELMGAALLCPATFLLCPQFGLPRRLWPAVAVAVGIAPGIEFLISSCFLSHVLCMPALVANLAGAARLARGGSTRPLVGTAAALALGFAVYTEFAPLFFGTTAAALTAGIVCGSLRPRRAALVAAALTIAVCMNPAALDAAVNVWLRGASTGPAMTLPFPLGVWASCLWVNYHAAAARVFGAKFTSVRALVLCCTVAAALGIVSAGVRGLRSSRRLRPAVAAACSLFVPPLVLTAMRPDSVYMQSKLVWTLGPFLVVFIACCIRELAFGVRSVRTRQVPVAGLWLVAAIFGFQIVTDQQDHLLHNRRRGELARVWNDAGLRDLCAELRARPSCDLVIALDTAEPNAWVEASALCYHGRRHRVRMASPQQIWLTPLQHLPLPQLIDVTAVPAGALVIRSGGLAIPDAAGEVVSRHGKYEVVRVTQPGTYWGERLLASRGARTE
ncbi:hypothetical protein [Frigoriglobus tundricola]|uniref:Glycosyltransferase RgtA/B/C/D-like domain-containing protein n=1 Tax=Frigoriglobus tundricola TaxID=2774151 RepID=A0A6M5YYY9_9BACT|nr:hypothetical protein [Frigoriglobus tundricola]QJW99347.1 hypothetical protein FTUN_6955 [Frigoriglobus tundricola]